jgi:hypothetical protein
MDISSEGSMIQSNMNKILDEGETSTSSDREERKVGSA